MYQPYQPPPAQKARVWPWFLGAAVVMAVFGMFAAIGYANRDQTRPAATSTRAGQGETVTLEYAVEGTATGVTVRYSTWSDGNWSSSTEKDVTAPWNRSEDIVDGALSGGTLTVTTGPEGGEVTCSITVDGKKLKTARASGKYAVAYCNGV